MLFTHACMIVNKERSQEMNSEQVHNGKAKRKKKKNNSSAFQMVSVVTATLRNYEICSLTRAVSSVQR